jgi:hypothetical protein
MKPPMTPYDKKSSSPRSAIAGIIVWYGRLPPCGFFRDTEAFECEWGLEAHLQAVGMSFPEDETCTSVLKSKPASLRDSFTKGKPTLA